MRQSNIQPAIYPPVWPHVQPYNSLDLVNLGCVLELRNDDGSTSRATDTSGKGNHGVITGATSVGAPNGLALLMDGTDDKITITKNASINDLPQLTIEMWINIKSSATTKHLFAKRFLGYTYSNLTIAFEYPRVTTSGGWLTPANTIVLNKWMHCVFTYDTTSTDNDAIIYKNGKSISLTEYSTPVGAVLSDAAYDLTLGSNGAIGFINANYGYTRLYNRIITPAEVNTLYNDGAPKFGLPSI